MGPGRMQRQRCEGGREGHGSVLRTPGSHVTDRNGGEETKLERERGADLEITTVC